MHFASQAAPLSYLGTITGYGLAFLIFCGKAETAADKKKLPSKIAKKRRIGGQSILRGGQSRPESTDSELREEEAATGFFLLIPSLSMSR